MSRFALLLARLYRRCLHLYPPVYRQELGSEQADVFELAIQDALALGGWQALLQVLRELRDLPVAVLRVRLQRRDGDMLSPIFPKAADETPWGVALLSLAPFFILGPVLLAMNYLPTWVKLLSTLGTTRLIANTVGILLVGGLAAGAWKKFPRWSYPYSVFGVFMLSEIVIFFVTGKPWNINDQAYLLPLLVAIVFLLTRLIPFLRSYQSNLRRDWTMLSYGLFSITLILVSLHDSDVVPRFNLFLLLPSLVCLAGMLAYLRLTSSLQRFTSLMASMLLAVLLWALPVFSDGSMVGFPGGLFFVRVVLASWGILAALVTAPMLIGVYYHFAEHQAA